MVIFLFYVIGLYLGNMLGAIGFPGLFLCLGLLLVFGWAWKNPHSAILSSWLILVIFLFFGIIRYQSAYQSITHEIEISRSLVNYSSVQITGKVINNPALSRNRISFLLSDVKIQLPGQLINFQSKLYLEINQPPRELELLYGDRVTYQSKLMFPEQPRNPGAFDYREYLKNNGIAGINKIVPGNIVTITYNPGFWEGVIEAPQRLSSWLKYRIVRMNNLLIPSPYNSIANGISLGIQSDIPDDVKDVFYYGGIYHLLVVSGGNIMMVAVMAFFLLRLFRLNRRMAMAGSMPVIILYSMVVGFSPPVSRALVMSITIILAGFIRRDTQPINSLALAGMIILWFNPLSIQNGSFLLSFMAVFGLITLSPILYEYLPIKNKTLRLSLITTLSPMLATLPILMKYFNYLSTVSLLSNLIASPLIFLSLPLTFITAILWPVSISFASAFAQCNGLCIFLMAELTHWLTLLPGAYFNIPDIPLWMMAVYYVFLIGFISGFQPENKFPDYAFRKRWLATSLLACLVLGSVWILDLHPARFQAVFLDVGEGDCIILRFPNQKTVLIDGGRGSPYDFGKNVILPYLRKAGIQRVDVMVVTHADEDHAGGLVSVLNNYPVDQILVSTQVTPEDSSYQILLGTARKKNIPVNLVVRGDRLAGFTPWNVEVLNPAPEPFSNTGSDENNNSVVLRVSHGQRSLLLTGDIGLEAESELVSSGVPLSSEILKVSHHGSRFGSSLLFLDKVRPRIAIIPVGKQNVFDHPSPETINRLTTNNITVYRTDESGAVILELTPRGWQIETWLYRLFPD